MKIGNKIFLYSMGVSILTLLTITLLFTLLFPDLYLQSLENKKLQELYKLQTYYQQNNTLIHSGEGYGVNTITLAIQPETYEIRAESVHGMTQVQISDPTLQQILTEATTTKLADFGTLFKAIEPYISNQFTDMFHVIDSQKYVNNTEGVEFFEIINYQGIEIYKGGIHIDEGQYLNLFTLYQSEDTLYITYAPLVQSSFRGIVLIALQIIGAILGVLLVALFIVNSYFSRQLSKPIQKLTQTTLEKESLYRTTSVPIREDNEIKVLEQSLHNLLSTLEHHIKEVEQEKKNQEFFIQASSHQLKTPIASSLLVLSGMIDNIGVYRDHTNYLPKLKIELLRLKEIVDNMLAISLDINISYEPIDLQSFIATISQQHSVLCEEKRIHLHNSIDPNQTITSSRIMLTRIVENIIGNAITYSPEESRVTVRYANNSLSIENSNTHIDEAILPALCKPFTRGDTDTEGSGLGLYIASYYCSILGYTLSIKNHKNSVLVDIDMYKGGTHSDSNYRN